tara:strand:+ start:1635 stop:2474 length:840 start_codon:yes stop_codon:yes gene_type:complete
MVGENTDESSEVRPITELVTADRNGQASYYPSAPTAAYVQGAIHAALYGVGTAYTAAGLGLQQPLVSDALVNQAMFNSAVGSIALSFNLSENQRALRTMIENFVEETEHRDPIVMSREIERAICESAIRTPSSEEFVETTIATYRDLVLHDSLLAEIYDEMQAIDLRDGLIPMELVPNWEEIANGVDPYQRMENANQPEPINPIATTNFEAMAVTPQPLPGLVTTAPTVIQYVDYSEVATNAIPVNTLVVVGSIPPPQPPRNGNRNPSGRPRPGGLNGY